MLVEFITKSLEALGLFAVLGSITLSIVIAVLGVLPSIFVTSANVLIFGPYFGFLLSWIGEVLGAWVSFFLYRSVFKIKFENLIEKHVILKSITNSKGRKTGLLIFQARLIPFLPSGIVTLAGAISSIGRVYFLIATALGKIPSIALEALVGYDLINLNKNWIRLIFTVFVIGSMLLLLRKRAK